MNILYFRKFLLIISFFAVNNKFNIKNGFILLGFFSSFSWKSENNTMTQWISNSSLNNQNKNIRILNTHTEFNDNVDSNIAYTNLDKNENDPSGASLFLNTSYNYLDISKKKMNHDKDENNRDHNSKAEIEIKELIKKEIEKNNKTGEEEQIKKSIAQNKINRGKKERDIERYEEDNDEIDDEIDDEEDEEKDKPKDKKIKKLIHHEIRKINEKIEKDIQEREQEREQEKSHHEIKGNKTIAIEIKNENTNPKIKCSNKLNYIELESSNIDKKFTSENYNNDVISFINIKTKDKISFIDKINENIAKIKDNYDINKISNIEQMEVEPNNIKKDQKIVDEQIKNKNKVQDNTMLHNNSHSFLDSKEYNKYHLFFNNNLKNINKHINAHKYNDLNGTVKSNGRIKSGFTNFLVEKQEDDSHAAPINFGRRSSVLNITNDEYSKLLNEGSVLVYDKDEVVPYKYDAFEVKDDHVDDMKHYDNNNNSHIDGDYINDISSQNSPEEEDQFKGMILTCVTVIIILTIIILIGFIIYYYDIINKVRVKLQTKGKNNKSMTIKNDKSSGMYIDNYYDDSTHV